MYNKAMTSLHSPEYKRFLKRLKKARFEAGLTQSEVSKALGVAQSFVSKSESGERRVDIIELKRFAKIYKKSLNYFSSDRK
jgi:transcriptional regulator with XRE-family HTH domain